ncbi:histidine kinase [Promicromonospora sp. NPDC050249]|uniref:sensor histidine kinase n=1 Tax=Promicromonospora sp. NPDC050249 TaxID=3154743 RepID=UPI0033F0FDD2
MSRTADLLAPITRVVLAEDRRGDVITAVGLLAIALALDALGLVRTSWSGLAGVSSWWFVVPAVVGCTALVWRRFHPLGALGVVTVAFAADVALGGSVGLLVVLWEALYAVHLHGRPAARRVTAVGVGAASLASMIVVGEATGEARFAILAGLQAVTLLVMPMWWGANVRQGRELTAAAHERARLERERGTALLSLSEAARHDAVRAERTSVARDLHDVVASHLSAITITSGAALAGEPEPERDRAALRSIRAESLASLQDMQAMIRVLSAGSTGAPGGGSDLLAAPRVAQLPQVLEQVRLAGLELTVTDPDGVLTGDTVLPAAVDHAVYRVVRESLTNVLKHGGARVQVRVAAADTLELEVCDDGVRPGGTTSDPADVGEGTGLGLVSMRERVESLGGSFAAGPVEGGSDCPPGGAGWRVRAVLPLPATVADRAADEVADRAADEAADEAAAEPAPSDRAIPGLHA